MILFQNHQNIAKRCVFFLFWPHPLTYILNVASSSGHWECRSNYYITVRSKCSSRKPTNQSSTYSIFTAANGVVVMCPKEINANQPRQLKLTITLFTLFCWNRRQPNKSRHRSKTVGDWVGNWSSFCRLQTCSFFLK